MKISAMSVKQTKAEGEGFEPSEHKMCSTVFETAPFNHSGTLPVFGNCKSIKNLNSLPKIMLKKQILF